jgi:hypothetical protein
MYLNKLKLLNKVKEVVVCVKGQIHFNEVWLCFDSNNVVCHSLSQQQ